MTLFDFSSKQSFEEQSKFINMMMKLYGSLICKSITLACMALLDIFKDQIDQSLDLMTKNDFCLLKDQTVTVMDFLII